MKAVAHSTLDHSAAAKPAPQVMAKAGVAQIPKADMRKIFQDGVSTGKQTEKLESVTVSRHSRNLAPG